MSTIYTGPAKVGFNSVALVAEGDAGTVSAVLNEDAAPIVGTFYGYCGEIVRNQVAEISFNPFDDWSLLATLLPYAVVHTGATTTGGTGTPGAFIPGAAPHFRNSTDQKPLVLWTPDARSYTFHRSAITRPPSLRLAVDAPLYGGVTFTAISKFTTGTTLAALGADGCICTVAETAGVEPTPLITASNIIRGQWTGIWGTQTGFTTAVEGEDGWSLECDANYSMHACQGRVIASTFNSVRFMARCRPFGPTHTEVLNLVRAHTLGEKLTTAHDLVLSGPSNRFIVLKKAAIKGMGFQFGGTTLGQGEIGFVTVLTTTVAGTMDPMVVCGTTA